MSAIVEMPQERTEMPRNVIAPSATPADLLRIAVESGADLDRLERLMALQERWEAKQAKQAYDAAFAAFKAEAVVILKGKAVTDGPLKGKSYAELHDVVNAVTPALSRHGLSSSWKLTRDEKEWMEVTCYLRHINGHEESVSMGGPPDTGGAKNAIQARASTKTYLERYTLKAITGLSEQNDDNDGRGLDVDLLAEWTGRANAAMNLEVLNTTRKMGAEAFNQAKDVTGWNAFKIIIDAKAKELRGYQQ